MVTSCGRHNNGMQRSADTQAFIFSEGTARPLMPGVMPLRQVEHYSLVVTVCLVGLSFRTVRPSVHRRRDYGEKDEL